MYTSSEWVAAVASAVASISHGTKPANTSESREENHDGSSSQRRDGLLLVEVMVHPGYPAATWDDFNCSSEREKELQVMCTVNAQAISDAVRDTGVARGGGVDVDVCALEQVLAAPAAVSTGSTVAESRRLPGRERKQST